MRHQLAAFAGTVRRFVRHYCRRPEQAVLTHTPGDWCKPGAVYERDGKRWLVTELRRESPTGLIGGGRAPCWSVWGKRIDDLPNAQAVGLRPDERLVVPDSEPETPPKKS
jgi:hypothetical protein